MYVTVCLRNIYNYIYIWLYMYTYLISVCACADIKRRHVLMYMIFYTLPQTWPVSCRIMTYGPAFHWTRSSCPIRWRHEPFTQQVSTAPNPSCLSLQHSKFWNLFFHPENHLHLVDSDFWIFLVEFPLSHMTLHHGPPRLRRFVNFSVEESVWSLWIRWIRAARHPAFSGAVEPHLSHG